jgi:hypothetical protein
MDAIRAELERVYQLVAAEVEVQARAKMRQQQMELEDREAALAAAMELASVDPAVRAAFRDGIAEERGRWLALIDERMEMLRKASISYTVLKALRDAGEVSS